MSRLFRWRLNQNFQTVRANSQHVRTCWSALGCTSSWLHGRKRMTENRVCVTRQNVGDPRTPPLLWLRLQCSWCWLLGGHLACSHWTATVGDLFIILPEAKPQDGLRRTGGVGARRVCCLQQHQSTANSSPRAQIPGRVDRPCEWGVEAYKGKRHKVP